MNFEPAATGSVTRVQIARYAGAVGDFNPIHVDEEFAKAAGLPSVIAHGPLTTALILDVLVSQLETEMLGAIEVRLRAPVFPGDTLTVVPSDDGAEAHKADGSLVATLTVKDSST